jgi:hypothetical protein
MTRKLARRVATPTAPSRPSWRVLRGKDPRFDHFFMPSINSHKSLHQKRLWSLPSVYLNFLHIFLSWNLSIQGKRIFIKDMAYYLVPPEGRPAQIAPSLGGKVKKGVGTNGYSHTNGVTNRASNGLSNGTKSSPYPYNTESEPGNPTVVPSEILENFHFTFLIRHPRYSIPSYYRCTVPPLDAVTGFYDFMPNEAGYDELRRVFEYLQSKRFIGPALAGEHDGQLKDAEISITVVDADDLLDNPNSIIEAFCKEVGISYTPAMLNWDSEKDYQQAKDAFEKWNGFHNDAIGSSSLKPRSHAHVSFSFYAGYGCARYDVH